MNTQNPSAEPIDVAEAGLRLAILDVLRKITALRAKIGGSGAERVTAGVRTAEMARQDPQPRDRWRNADGEVYRVVAVDPPESDVLVVWEDSAEDPAFFGGETIGEEGEEYLGVSATLLGAP